MIMPLFERSIQRADLRERESESKAMGRPPCCDKVGIKKGPWTPEEDIILVSYIQEHGPGNWRSVPTNTGLMRCSKSCRLRWTNYLRPGIKRGNFTPHEEGMIIHLQALLGNKWAAIASYLPQRTDNDIKNYWNTHLKKKLNKFQSALAPVSHDSSTSHEFASNSLNERKALDITNNSILRPNNLTSTSYASSTENISRLLEGWMRSSPKPRCIPTTNNDHLLEEKCLESNDHGVCNSMATKTSLYGPKAEQEAAAGDHDGRDLISQEEFESILSFENMNSSYVATIIANGCEDSSASDDKGHHNDHRHVTTIMSENKKQKCENNSSFSFLEKWLFDEASTGQVEDIMELSPLF